MKVDFDEKKRVAVVAVVLRKAKRSKVDEKDTAGVEKEMVELDLDLVDEDEKVGIESSTGRIELEVFEVQIPKVEVDKIAVADGEAAVLDHVVAAVEG